MQVIITANGKNNGGLPSFEIDAFDNHGEQMFYTVAHSQCEAEDCAKHFAKSIEQFHGEKPEIKNVNNFKSSRFID